MKECIIYLLKNTVNQKVYVGQTWQSLRRRFHGGIGYAECIYLNNAIKKYGKDKFYYEPVAYTDNQFVADDMETYYIEKYKTTNRKYGYNIRSGGRKGSVFTPETIVKMKVAHKGKSSGFKGKKHSDESKILISHKAKRRYRNKSVWNKGRKFPELHSWNKLFTDVQENQIEFYLNNSNLSQQEISCLFGCHQTKISNIKRK